MNTDAQYVGQTHRDVHIIKISSVAASTLQQMILLPSIEGLFSTGGGLAGAVTVVSLLAGKTG